MFYQNDLGEICQSAFGIHQNVKILCLLFDTDEQNYNMDNFVYSYDVLTSLSKKYLSVINPEKFDLKIDAIREKDRERDKKRDATLKRKEMHRGIDEKRDKTPNRKKMHKMVD